MYYTLNFIETLLYKQSLEEQINKHKKSEEKLSQFYTFFQIFIGQLSIDSKQLFTGNSLQKTQSNPITTEPVFYKTNLLRKQIKENMENIASEIEASDFHILKKQFEHIDKIFNTIVTIEKKMINDDMYFVYSETTQYTSWSEFIELFSSPIYFLSNNDKSAINLFPNDIPKQTIKTIRIWLYEKIVSYLSEKVWSIEKQASEATQCIFIASTRKEESKQLFELLYKSKLHEKYTIVAENITWGAGKNIFKLKNNSKKIVIWGYAFLLAVYADNISLDEIIVFNIRGNNEQSILNDMQWYANK
jgi:hypothetical protein